MEIPIFDCASQEANPDILSASSSPWTPWSSKGKTPALSWVFLARYRSVIDDFMPSSKGERHVQKEVRYFTAIIMNSARQFLAAKARAKAQRSGVIGVTWLSDIARSGLLDRRLNPDPMDGRQLPMLFAIAVIDNKSGNFHQRFLSASEFAGALAFATSEAKHYRRPSKYKEN